MPNIRRTIQYFGLLKLPEERSRIKSAELYVQILRPPFQVYYSEKTNVPSSFFGYVQEMSESRFVSADSVPIGYERTKVLSYRNDKLWVQSLISCHLEAIFSSIINLGLFLNPGYVTERNNPISAWQISEELPDFYAIKLLTERTVAVLDFTYELIDSCSVPGAPSPSTNSPLPVPDLVSPVLPDGGLPTGTAISPPYTGVDDGGLTYRPDGDTPFPQGDTCAAYELTFTYTLVEGTLVRPGIRRTRFVYGIVEDLFVFKPVNEDVIQIICVCGGDSTQGTCVQGTELVVESFAGTGIQSTADIVDIEFISLVGA